MSPGRPVRQSRGRDQDAGAPRIHAAWPCLIAASPGRDARPRPNRATRRSPRRHDELVLRTSLPAPPIIAQNRPGRRTFFLVEATIASRRRSSVHGQERRAAMGRRRCGFIEQARAGRHVSLRLGSGSARSGQAPSEDRRLAGSTRAAERAVRRPPLSAPCRQQGSSTFGPPGAQRGAAGPNKARPVAAGRPAAPKPSARRRQAVGHPMRPACARWRGRRRQNRENARTAGLGEAVKTAAS